MAKLDLLTALKKATNLTKTTNGATAYLSTGNAVYDFFALAGGMRNTPVDALDLFIKAWYENKEMALKALFYLRDCREGQGERDIFRLCFIWLLNTTDEVRHLIPLIPTYGRWDDLITILDIQDDRDYERAIYESLIYKQLVSDMKSEHPSLCAKWLPSINTSSNETRRKANKIRRFLDFSPAEYRKMLSILRKRIKVLERIMSAQDWDAIEFDKVPSGANVKYKNCFLRREETAERYRDFIQDDTKSIHSSVLYPYQIISKMLDYNSTKDSDAALNKMWDNLPDYFGGSDRNILCVVDTSGSMTGCNASAPINSAIGMGIYAAQRMKGVFHNHYITFASEPRLVEIKGDNTAEQARYIRRKSLVDNTNLEKVFDLILDVANTCHLDQSDLPDTIVVISDMQIDEGTGSWGWNDKFYAKWSETEANTEMEKIRVRYAAAGYELPHLVYWNVEASNPTILDSGDNVTFVSGLAPTHFKAICAGLKGTDLMYETLLAERYAAITLE